MYDKKVVELIKLKRENQYFESEADENTFLLANNVFLHLLTN